MTTPFRDAIRRTLATVLFAIAITAVLPSGAQAQSCTTRNPPCPPNTGPSLGIDPSSDTVSTPSVDVTVFMHDDHMIDGATFSSSVNGLTLKYNPYPVAAEATGKVPLTNGTTTMFTARVCDNAGLCAADTAYYTYIAPPPPPMHGQPIVSTAPHNGENVDLANCVVDCFDGLLGYTTPTYITRDIARGVTFTYRSSQAAAEARIALDVSQNSQVQPTTLSLKIRDDQTSAFQPLVDTSTTEYWTPPTSGAGPARIAVTIPLSSSRATGAYSYTATIWNNYTDTVPLATSTRLRVLVVNESNSPYGAGVSIVGLQRIYAVGDTAVTITDGTGSIAYFRRATCDATACTYIAPAGDFTRLTRDSVAHRYLRKYNDGTVLTFSKDGYNLLEKVRSRYPDSTLYSYDAYARLAQITDPTGQRITFYYHAGNTGRASLDSLTDGATPARRTAFSYDAAGNLARIVEADGLAAIDSATYSSEHRLLWFRTRIGARWNYDYDCTGSLSVTTGPAIQVNGQSVRQTLHLVSQRRQTSICPSDGRGTSAANPSSATLADSARATLTDSRGSHEYYYLSRFGAPLRLVAQDTTGHLLVSAWEYNQNGLVTRAAPAGGEITTYEWSGGDLVKVVDLTAGLTTRIAYEPTYHQDTAVWLGTTLVQHSFYSGTLLTLDSVTTDSASTTRLTHDSLGRVLTVTDPEGHRTSLSYFPGATQNTQTLSYVDGGRTRTMSYTYDAYGRQQSATDFAARVQTVYYDRLNRDTLTSVPGSVVRKSYNDAARVYTVTTPRGLVYTSALNVAGVPDSTLDPLGGVERYHYDRNGQMESYTNRRGQEVRFQYDTLGRMKARVAGADSTSFAYDSAGRWVVVSNSESTDSLYTDGAGRIDREVSVREGKVFVHTYAYDGNGLPNEMEASYPSDSGKKVQYWYTPSQLLRTIAGFDGQVTGVHYDLDEQRDTLILPDTFANGVHVQETFTYNSATHREARVAFNQAGLDNVLGRTYSYDSLGLLSSVARGPSSDLTQRYLRYQASGRLQSYYDVHYWQETSTELVCPTREITSCYHPIIYHQDTVRRDAFAYDSVGNRTDHGGAYQDSSNRLASFNGYAFAYDADGNLTQKYKTDGTFNQSYTWDALGQLTSVTTNGNVVRYYYDGVGRRVRSERYVTVNGSIAQVLDTGYVYAGLNLVAVTAGNGVPVQEFSYYSGIDQPHSMRRVSDGAVFYYTTEQPGNVTGLLDKAGQQVDSYQYTPFGEAVAVSEQVPQPFRFMARQFDQETGLYYFRARYYDPSLGRFLSEDPIGLAGGLNPYVFPGNDPVNSSDPLGLVGCPAGYHRVDMVYIEDEKGNVIAIIMVCGPESAGLQDVFITLYNPNVAQPAHELSPVYSTAEWRPMPSLSNAAILAYMYSLNLQNGGYTWSESKAPKTLDCSHFTNNVMQLCGCALPYENTAAITTSRHYQHVAPDKAQAGDFIVGYYKGSGHVGIYQGYKNSDGGYAVVDWGTRFGKKANPHTVTYWLPNGSFKNIGFYRPVCGGGK